MAQLIKLRFVHHAGAYNPNEIAGFVPDVAARLVRLGVAYPVDQPAPDSDELAAMAAEQLAFGAKAGRSETGLSTVVPAGAMLPATNQRIALAHQVLDSQPHPGARQGLEAPEAQAFIEGIPPMTSPEVSAAANEGPGGGARVGAPSGGRHGPSTLPSNAPTVDDPGPAEASDESGSSTTPEKPGAADLPDEPPPTKARADEPPPKKADADEPPPKKPERR